MLRKHPKNRALKAAQAALSETLASLVDDDDYVTGAGPRALGNVGIMCRRSRVGQYFHYFPPATSGETTMENAREALDKFLFFFSFTRVASRRIPAGIRFFSFFFSPFSFSRGSLATRTLHFSDGVPSRQRTEKRPLLRFGVK